MTDKIVEKIMKEVIKRHKLLTAEPTLSWITEDRNIAITLALEEGRKEGYKSGVEDGSQGLVDAEFIKGIKETGKKGKYLLSKCEEGNFIEHEHDMIWKCKGCGMEFKPEHSHKTCINKFDKKVEEKVKEAIREILDRIEKLRENPPPNDDVIMIGLKDWRSLRRELLKEK